MKVNSPRDVGGTFAQLASSSSPPSSEHGPQDVDSALESNTKLCRCSLRWPCPTCAALSPGLVARADRSANIDEYRGASPQDDAHEPGDDASSASGSCDGAEDARLDRSGG